MTTRDLIVPIVREITADWSGARRSEHALTFLNSRALQAVVHRTTRRHGERVVITEWLDDAAPENGGYPAGTFVVQHIIGDGRIVNPNDRNAMRTLARIVVTTDGEVIR